MPSDKRAILIADDDLDDQEFIQEAIESVCREEVTTHYVSDGIALMDFLRRNGGKNCRPAFIVLDLNMPRKDGRATLREMKADARLCAIPVVVLTTSRSEEDRRLCESLGAQGYYQKPSRARDLEAIFSSLCREYLS